MMQKHLNGLVGVPYSFEETSLSGTEIYRAMKDAKTIFNGVDDDFLDLSSFPRDISDNIITLESQRIRMFKFTLKSSTPMPRPSPSNHTVHME